MAVVQAHLMDLKPCEPSTGCIEALHQLVPLSLNYPYDPLVLVTVVGNGGQQQKEEERSALIIEASIQEDTFVASLHNITARAFEVGEQAGRLAQCDWKLGGVNEAHRVRGGLCCCRWWWSGERGGGVWRRGADVEGAAQAGMDRTQRQQGSSKADRLGSCRRTGG